MKYLYKKSKTGEALTIPDGLTVEVFTPKLFGGLTLPGEGNSIKLQAVRLMFQLSTLGKAKIYVCRQNGELAHTAYVIPKCSKFPFLTGDDYEIGPCLTYPAYRGKGIYPTVLRYICSSVGSEKTCFYMIVDSGNGSSIRGIEKAGFEKCGSVKVSKLTKSYHLA